MHLVTYFALALGLTSLPVLFALQKGCPSFLWETEELAMQLIRETLESDYSVSSFSPEFIRLTRQNPTRIIVFRRKLTTKALQIRILLGLVQEYEIICQLEQTPQGVYKLWDSELSSDLWLRRFRHNAFSPDLLPQL